jgi:hypothetical protein
MLRDRSIERSFAGDLLISQRLCSTTAALRLVLRLAVRPVFSYPRDMSRQRIVDRSGRTLLAGSSRSTWADRLIPGHMSERAEVWVLDPFC